MKEREEGRNEGCGRLLVVVGEGELSEAFMCYDDGCSVTSCPLLESLVTRPLNAPALLAYMYTPSQHLQYNNQS